MLARALAGERRGHALRRRRSSATPRFKLWLKYAKPARGTVVVDAGAARALREGGASLLPVGVVEVDGGFGQGDAVEVSDGASVIGKGISNYSAADLRRVLGQKSDEVRGCCRGPPTRRSTATTSCSA